ncbi:MAG: FkbM family methyltransferase [Bacteroidetes bacterium]|jgi:FkbM family methyltransferase|nr:MAG: FkbM family methyltransferase [Bacteroidota bacterium]
MSNTISLKIGEWMYQNIYGIYKPLYFLYKKRTEKFEIDLIKKIVRPGDVVLDIGANIGFYTMIFSEAVKEKGKVFAFEPDPKNFHRLKNNTQYLGNVIVENKAISHQTQTIKLYSSELNVDYRTYAHPDSQNYTEVQAVSLDDYLREKNITCVDFIKMDIQGYESFALQGMIETIKKNKHIKILSEFWPYGLQQSGKSAITYYQQLSEYFSNIFLLQNHQLKKILPDEIQHLKNSPQHYYNIFAYND